MLSLRSLKDLQIDSARISLRWLLVVPFVLQTVGATALVGYLSYRSGQQAVENLANQLLLQTSERVSDRLTSYLQPAQQVIAANLLEVEQGTLNPNNLEQMRRQLWQQMTLNPDLPSIGFSSDRGTAIAYGKIASEAEKEFIYNLTKVSAPVGTPYLNESSSGKRRYFWVDAQGNPQKQLLAVEDDFRQKSWYLEAKTLQQQHWLPVFITAAGSHLVIRAVAPILDIKGKFQGVFTSYYALSQISTFLNELKFSPSGQVFVIERSGNLIATSVPSEALAMRRVDDKPDRLSVLASQDEPTRSVATQLLQRFDSFRDLGLQQLEITVGTESNFVQVTPYQDRYGLDWLIVTVIPASDFMTAIQEQNGYTFLLCCGTLVATTLLGLFTARRITAPLLRLNASAQKIAQNDFDHPVQVGGLGEVKQLSQTFQQMAQQLLLSLQLRTNYEQELKQKVAEQTAELAQAKDLREAIFNESTDAIFLVESPPTSRILDCNQRTVAMFEVESKVELIGIQGTTLQKYPYTPTELAEIGAELQQKGFWSREIEFVTKAGRSFWGNLAAKPISVGGEILQLIRLTDISERKRVEQERQQLETQLLRTRQWLQQYSHQSPSSIYTLVQEPDGRLWLEYTSSAVEAIHEITQEQALENIALILDQMHPDDRPGYAEAVTRSIEMMDIFIYEWRIITPSGKLKWIQATSQPEQRSNGTIAWHGVVLDITERKQVENSLRESEERFRQAFDHAAIGVALVSPEGRFLKVNRSLCEMLGYREAELLKRSFQDITDPADLDTDMELVRQMLMGERRTYQFEKRYIHKQGMAIWVLLCVSLVKDEAGTPLYFVSQVQDMSDRHKIDEIKDEFASIVSHELRTPLTSIHGSLRILESGILKDKPDTAQEMLHVALKSTDRLVRLVNDILDLERLESGKAPLTREICEVNDLIEMAAASVQILADQSEVILNWTPLSASVHADPDNIVQVITNLLSNAIKFSPPGKTIWIKAERLETQRIREMERWEERNVISATSYTLAPASPQPHVLFSIADQGRGIPPEKRESIFERFQQVDASDARQKGGTGLGLAICKTIVQQHGGQIWVESVVGQGSTFYFTLPIVPPSTAN